MDLQDLQSINLSAGRPSSSLTNEIWQKRFECMRLLIKPSCQKKMTTNLKKAIVNKSYAVDDNDTTVPMWARYRWNINDVLKTIRSGDHDYIYYIYGISDLLKFEHDRLCTLYREKDMLFEVWLDNTKI